MAYISSNANRWYVGLESAFGQIPALTSANRIPAVKLTAGHQLEKSHRKDKTGSRTWAGLPAGMRQQTTFELSSYMRDWPDVTVLPSHGPLVEAALGKPGMLWEGGTVAAGTTASHIKFAGPHGLVPGQAVTFDGEIRFVAALADPSTIILNAPFSKVPATAGLVGATATYNLQSELPSFSLFDYWDPSSAVQRVLTGGAVDKMSIDLNGDFHEMTFKGFAQDLVDSVSFGAGQGGASSFPAEPAVSGFSYSPVPGNLGQVWLGVIPNQFFTVAKASVEVRNDISVRACEFGSILPRAIAPGTREVVVTLELFGQDDEASSALYQAARQFTPISIMFQMGQLNGQLMGVYLKSVLPQVPAFDDSDRRLKWKFSDSRAQGTVDDEMVVAFG